MNTTAWYASSDTDFEYTAAGCNSNNTDLGCTTIGNMEFNALGTGWLGIPVLYTVVGYVSSDINHAVISFVYTAIGYACSDFILAYTAIGYTNNDINLGCTTVGKIELSALIGLQDICVCQ